MMRDLGAVALLAVSLAACSSSGHGAATGSTSPQTSRTTTTTRPPDPNVAACEQVHAYVLDRIKPTFNSWKPDANEFDQRVGRQLRAEATHLFTLETRATGSPATAIHDEAKALTNVSVAIEEADDTAIGTAANDANTALAELRGACNF